jgi:hypothetical protein
MKLTLMKNGLPGVLAACVQKLERRLLHVAVEERDADHAVGVADAVQRDGLAGLVDVLAVDLEIFLRFLARFAGHRSLGHLVEHGPQLRVHIREPGRIAVGVGVEVVQADVLHLVIALRVGQGVVASPRCHLPVK